MPLLDILRSKSHRIKLEVELAKQHSQSSGKFECYLCPKYFGKSERFPTHEALVTHHRKAHRRGIVAPLEKKSIKIADPIVTTKSDIEDFHIWWIIFKSKYPHFEFVKRHRSSWSNGEQYILLDIKRKVKVAMTLEEMKEKLGRTSAMLN